MDRLHFVRPYIHALRHIAPEIERVGSLRELSQYLLERIIGDLGAEIRLHSDPFANLSQRMIERAQINAMHSLIPDLMPKETKLPHSAIDLGDGYILLGPSDYQLFEGAALDAYNHFVGSRGWRTKSQSFSVFSFARLRLPNSQRARCLWQEKKREDAKVRRARNVKVSRQQST